MKAVHVILVYGGCVAWRRRIWIFHPADIPPNRKTVLVYERDDLPVETHASV
jgi:hypothetical protein